MIARAASNTTSPEILVIGAGPAGAVAAAELAGRGRNVLLVDRATFPRPKVCGCCLAPAGVAVLDRLELADLVASATPLRQVTLGTDAGAIDLPFEGSRVLGRDRLDPALIETAISRGARTAFDTRARIRRNGTVDLNDTTCTPAAIVVADGLAGGSLAGRPEFDWSVATTGRLGAGVVFDPTIAAPAPGELHMLVDRVGYLGIVRLPDDRIDLAAAFDARRARDAGGPAVAAAMLLTRHGMPMLGESARAARWRGTPTLSRRRRVVAQGSIACIGDAAGYVEPFTGEGMTWAMRSGVEVAAVVDAAIAEGTSLETWRSVHRRLFAHHHRRCRIVARAVRHPRLLHHGASWLSSISPWRRRLAGLATGAAPMDRER